VFVERVAKEQYQELCV